MDVIIPLVRDDLYNDFALRMCLRGIEKHLTNHRDVFIVGYKPKWLTEVGHISCEDKSHGAWKQQNICKKVLEACISSSVSKSFFFMNDDHFLIRETDTGNFPYYHQGSLRRSLDNRKSDPYCRTMRNTLELLEKRPEDEPLDFDVHTPIVYNKEKFMQAMSICDWENRVFGYCIKSVYGNMTRGIKGEKIADVKVKTEPKLHSFNLMPGKNNFSTNHRADMGEGSTWRAIFEKLYPTPSKFEIQ